MAQGRMNGAPNETYGFVSHLSKTLSKLLLLYVCADLLYSLITKYKSWHDQVGKRINLEQRKWLNFDPTDKWYM